MEYDACPCKKKQPTQHEALGNNYRVCGGYFPGPRDEVYFGYAKFY